MDKCCRLVNAKRAKIDKEKFTEYALIKPGKCEGFRKILGYDESNWMDLQSQIKQGVMKNKAKFHTIDQYGTKFTVDILVEGPKGSAIVRTGWIYEKNIEYPRLTTLFLFTK